MVGAAADVAVKLGTKLGLTDEEQHACEETAAQVRPNVCVWEVP